MRTDKSDVPQVIAAMQDVEPRPRRESNDKPLPALTTGDSPAT
jgi:hypothetical protein